MHLHDLDTIITVGELEQTVILAEYHAGLTPPGMSRPLHPWEVAARVDFARQDRTVIRGYQRTAAILDQYRDAVITGLVEALDGLTDPVDIADAVAEYLQSQPTAVQAAAAQTASDIADAVAEVYGESAAAVVDEALGQGVPAEQLPIDGAGQPTVTAPKGLGLVGSAAAGLVLSRIGLAALGAGGPARPATGSEVEAAARDTSIAGAYDAARQGVNIAQGAGRADVANEAPTPAQIYASELLDGNTCDACLAIDGTEYATLDEAYTDYPDAGPYAQCEGGDRCRGTLVIVWPGES